MNRIVLKYTIFLLLLLGGFFPRTARSQVFVNADGVTDPYRILNSKGWYEEETTLHPEVKHLTQQWDPLLKKYVFAFTIHKEVDGDREKRVDRQRLEIKTYGPSPANMKAAYGETHFYRWKFKLDAAFQPSPSFCHLHQLKAGDGDDSGSPLITLTPRSGKPDRLQLIFVAPTAAGGATTYLKEVELAPFRGEWVEVLEKVTFAHDGSLEIVIRRVSDQAVLLEHRSDLLDLWRGTATFIRPKYGIYRSLNNLSYLRDETVLFADFSLYEGASLNVPAAPTALQAVPAADNQVKLSWTDHSGNEELFRVETSEDGSTWHYLATVPAGSSGYTTPGPEGNKPLWFRVCAENTAGNSAFSNTVTYSPVTGLVPGQKTPGEFAAWFCNGLLCFSHHLPQQQQARLSLHTLHGAELFSSAVDVGFGERQNSLAVGNLPGGIYVVRLAAGSISYTQKIFLKK